MRTFGTVASELLLAGIIAVAGIGLFLDAGQTVFAQGTGGGGCTGGCTFSNGTCYSDPTNECSGTGCACAGANRDDCLASC